jgi:5-methylcytosine-specific restriction endonuclease McrA
MPNKQDRKFLISIAKSVTDKLRTQIKETPVRLRNDRHLIPWETTTDGWAVTIGSILHQKCWLDIWFDNYTGYNARKFWYGFNSNRRATINNVAKFGLKALGKPQLAIKDKDTIEKGNNWRLRNPLGRGLFASPIIEYYGTEFYYGLYDYGSNLSQSSGRESLIERMVDFFESLATNLPGKGPSKRREDFPATENRKVVVTHLRRERNSHLAMLRKRFDDFKCQICGMRFEDVYGPIGHRYAEAHHQVPLSKLRKMVSTTLNDLITVCPNCHRMLHKLEGKSGDINFLKKQISLHQMRLIRRPDVATPRRVNIQK